jgi:hypothetical protein
MISRRAQALYGPLGEGEQRIDAWQRLLATQKQISEPEQLDVVNQFFNRKLQYEEDIDLVHALKSCRDILCCRQSVREGVSRDNIQAGVRII